MAQQISLSKPQETPPEEIEEKIRRMETYFQSNRTLDRKHRIASLKRLKKALKAHEEEVFTAMKQELGRSEIDSFLTDIGMVYDEINYVIKHLKGWMRPKKMSAGILNIGSKAEIQKVPKGKVLIISPWNYPINLLLIPLVSVISAGNVALIKPSEFVPLTSAVIRKVIEEAFEQGYVEMAEGGPEVSQYLLKKPWGHIMFTGSPKVGKIVYKAAAETMTPVTLELGGKSPVIVDRTANLKLAAKRIALGKFFNNGQTCVAPDYVMVEEPIKEKFVNVLKDTVTEFYGKTKENPGYSRIINGRNFDRLKNMVEGQNIIVPSGEEMDKNERFIPPIFVLDPDMESTLSKEEIFGPILIIRGYNNEEDLMKVLAANPTPLAFYIFSTDKEFMERISRQYPSGDLGINSTAMHAGIAGVPFGGIGNSGIGKYKGVYGFDTFSHIKTVLKASPWFDDGLKYPPYPGFFLRVLRFLFR